ncbi:rod shape-determining protein MreD [Symmachiella dynata]|uniref:Rod shape-determining protein MreD n=1 Tax=Symmachiella dynata TaxID=2527995 RepID=A0A517ZKZ4_9PLAN|nr:rod shape-determining protein MreD [Symmachiella dynata]QDU43170.1 rod shape-determining protein MreD [Symmachiella dynata]
MQILFWVIGTYVLLVLQTTLSPSIALGPFTPNLLIALCVPCFYRRRSQWAVCGAAVWGLAVDAMGTGPVGINLIGFTLVGFLLQRVEPRKTISPMRILLTAAAAVVLLCGIEIAANWPLRRLVEHAQQLGVLWAGNALYTFAIATASILAHNILLRGTRHLTGHEAQDRQWSRPAIPW